MDVDPLALFGIEPLSDRIEERYGPTVAWLFVLVTGLIFVSALVAAIVWLR